LQSDDKYNSVIGYILLFAVVLFLEV
jgi:hypothetical protein